MKKKEKRKKEKPCKLKFSVNQEPQQGCSPSTALGKGTCVQQDYTTIASEDMRHHIPLDIPMP